MKHKHKWKDLSQWTQPRWFSVEWNWCKCGVLRKKQWSRVTNKTTYRYYYPKQDKPNQRNVNK